VTESTPQTETVYQEADPWQRLGTDIKQATSVAEALQLAGLDWTVSVHDLYYAKTSYEPATGEPSEDLIEVPMRKVVVRDQDSRILGTVGTAYKPMQNHEAFAVLDAAVSEFGVRFVAGGAYGPSQRSWLLARLPEDITIVDGDMVCPYFLVSTGHDGATPFLSVPTPYRPYCGNSLDLAFLRGFKDAAVRLTHSTDPKQNLDQVADMVESLLSSFRQATTAFRQMARTGPLSMETIQLAVDDILGIEPGDEVKGVTERRRARILELVDKGKGHDLARRSAWAVFNAVTEYVDHVRPAEATAKSQRSANEAALFGRNALLKARAFAITKALV
jgi:phage/plasmid-like protein (TIGR03299 family)